MPDLKSELSKVINSWETDMPNTPETGRRITTNSTRLTFNYVRDNPGVTRAAAVAGLTKLGVKLSSSTSLITVMLARGNLRTVNDGLFTTQAEYAPLPKIEKPKKAKPAPVVEAPKPVEPVQISTTWDAETVLNNLSIKQARALYDELRTIFGG